jgi:hypothetical protein
MSATYAPGVVATTATENSPATPEGACQCADQLCAQLHEAMSALRGMGGMSCMYVLRA